jgi:hypothetical protein
MWAMTQAALALLVATSACSNGGALPQQQGATGLVQTGLEGTVRRGPVQAACREGEPCDVPVQARFALQRDGHVVARFASDATGSFVVYAAPGRYAVIPDEPIGIGREPIEVTVEPAGLTHVDLTFDTGIR